MSAVFDGPATNTRFRRNIETRIRGVQIGNQRLKVEQQHDV
jgi:hypothetical protein